MTFDRYLHMCYNAQHVDNRSVIIKEIYHERTYK